MTYQGQTITPACATQWAWRTALNASVIAVTTGLALRYIPQPKFLTQYAGGRVFREAMFTKGLIAGALLGPFMEFAKLAVCCIPCCWPAVCVWECAEEVANGQCVGTSERCSIVSVLNDVAGRTVSLGLLLTVQGALMKRNIYPDHASMFCGFAAGSMATCLTISTVLKGFSLAVGSDSQP